MRKVTLLLIMLAMSVFSPIGRTVVVLPGQGVEFRQVDFLFSEITELNSDWGQVSVDPVTLSDSIGMNSGYLNVYTDVGWVIQNLPLGLGSHDSFVPIAEYFSLGLVSSQEINQLSAYVEFTIEPKHIFTDDVRSNFGVEHIQWNAEGVGNFPVMEIAEAPVSNIPTSEVEDDFVFEQSYDVNVQAAKNQCFPMAIANSLQYLENELGLEIPHEHEIGLKEDNSLVGQLDEKANRCVVNRENGCGVMADQMIKGKFSYLDENGLADKLVHKHQGSGWGIDPEDFKDESTGIVSKNKGIRVTWEWICNELKSDEDVEIVFTFKDKEGRKGAHAVRVYGCSSVLGIRRLAYLHDRLQTDEDPEDKEGVETVQGIVGDFDGDGILNLASTDVEIHLALSESLGITLNSFVVQNHDNLNLMIWETATETKNAGFRIWRSVRNNIGGYESTLLKEFGRSKQIDFDRLDENCSIKFQGQLREVNSNQDHKLISAVGNSTESTCYSFTDTSNLSYGTYYYLLEDISDDGNSTFHCNQIDTVTVGQGPAIDLESAINYCKEVTGSND